MNEDLAPYAPLSAELTIFQHSSLCFWMTLSHLKVPSGFP